MKGRELEELSANSFVGSRHFLAPEIVPDCVDPYSAAVDIYALGLLSWICITGGIPIEDDAGREVRIPPGAQETLEAWSQQEASESDPSRPSSAALLWVGTLTAAAPCKRGTARGLRTHPFFAEVAWAPPLRTPDDWEAFVPCLDDEPPGTPDSSPSSAAWSWAPHV